VLRPEAAPAMAVTPTSSSSLAIERALVAVMAPYAARLIAGLKTTEEPSTPIKVDTWLISS